MRLRVYLRNVKVPGLGLGRFGLGGLRSGLGLVETDVIHVINSLNERFLYPDLGSIKRFEVPQKVSFYC